MSSTGIGGTRDSLSRRQSSNRPRTGITTSLTTASGCKRKRQFDGLRAVSGGRNLITFQSSRSTRRSRIFRRRRQSGLGLGLRCLISFSLCPAFSSKKTSGGIGVWCGSFLPSSRSGRAGRCSITGLVKVCHGFRRINGSIRADRSLIRTICV